MTHTLRITTVSILLGLQQLHSATQTIDLATNSGTGSLYLSNINNETVEPNSGLPGSKNSDYPYYFDSSQGLWVFIADEQLSAGTSYIFEETNFTVLKNGATDNDFGIFDVGDISYDDSLLTGSGIEVLAPGDFTLTLDGSDFSPLFSPRKDTGLPGGGASSNEFAWDYDIASSSPSGTGLTFVNGHISSIDFTANIAVTPRFFGNPNPPFAFGSSYDGTVTFSGAGFVFDVDVIQDNTSALGALSDTHLVFNAAGNISSVVPEPSTYAGILGLVTLVFCIFRKQKRR